jgi:hypothetical protein
VTLKSYRTIRAFMSPFPPTTSKASETTLGGEFAKAFAVFFVVFLLAGGIRWMVLYPQSKKSNAFVPPPPAVGSPNYAKEFLQSQGKGSKPQISVYEKVGTLTARTRDFDQDEKSLRGSIRSEKAFIQQEKNEGLKGNRLLCLALAVEPMRFDALVEGIKRLGDLASFAVVKTDKTNDYRSLLAKCDSLKKNRDDLLGLQSRGAKVADLLSLQEKVFGVESEIQDLEISIRRYEERTGFCTVLLTLKDVGPGPSWTVLLNRAFGWTFEWSVGALVSVFFVLLGVMFLLWLVNQAKTAGKDRVAVSNPDGVGSPKEGV